MSKFELNSGETLEFDLNDLIFIILRLGEETKKDPRFKGSWSELTVQVRRRLYAKLNMSAFKDDGDITPL